jgi:hypothetical protein
METVIIYYSSPSHGWLAVPKALFPDAEEFGTGYGYWDGIADTVYLEEDCEMQEFLKAHPEARPMVQEKVVNNDLYIRSLPRNRDKFDESARREKVENGREWPDNSVARMEEDLALVQGIAAMMDEWFTPHAVHCTDVGCGPAILNNTDWARYYALQDCVAWLRDRALFQYQRAQAEKNGEK